MQTMTNTIQVGLRRWATWQAGSVNRQLFAAMMTVGGLTGLVKLTAFAKDIIVAHQFGTSDALDAFLIAYLLPQIFINLIGGSLNAALIPTYIQVREQEGAKAAERVFASVMLVTSGFLLATSLVLALTASVSLPILASGFSPEKLTLAISLYCMLLVTLVLNGLSTTWGAVLNAGNRFAIAAMAPMATSIVTVFMILNTTTHWGIYALAGGTVGGALIEAGLLGWGLAREGVSLVPRWWGLSPAVKQVLKQYSPTVAGAFFMAGTSMVSQAMAAMLSPGSVSSLAYGSKVTNLILGMGAVAVSTAVLPHFSRMVATSDWHNLRHTVMTYMRLLLIITLPMVLVLSYFSAPVVAMMFQRGAFTQADTQVVSEVQAMYLLQVPPYMLTMLLVRMIASFKANHLLMWAAFINLSATTIFTYFFMQWFGVVGIALATSVSFLMSCCFLLLVSLRLMKQK